MTRTMAAAGLMATVLAVAVGTSTGETTRLAVGGRVNATPSIAARGDAVVVAWGATVEGGAADVYAALSRDGGLTFGTPVRVNDVPGDARLSGEQPPHVSLVPRTGGGSSIVVVWTTKATGGTRLLMTKSDDDGRTFSRSAPVPGTEAAGNRGWEATATDGKGRVLALWLDHRELAAPMAAMHHEGAGHEGHAAQAPEADGAAKAQMSKLYFGSIDGALPARALTGGVCYCCKAALAVGGDGTIVGAWRHVYPGNIRDIAVTVSRDGGRTFSSPARVSDDHWMLDGCPENGPSVVVDGQSRVHVAWPTVVQGAGMPEAALFYAVSSDGHQFPPRLRLPTEQTPRHPQMVVDAKGQPIVTWDEQQDGVKRVVVGRWQANGAASGRFTREVVSTAASGSYPSIAAASGASIVAWAETTPTGSAIRVRRVAK